MNEATGKLITYIDIPTIYLHVKVSNETLMKDFAKYRKEKLAN